MFNSLSLLLAFIFNSWFFIRTEMSIREDSPIIYFDFEKPQHVSINSINMPERDILRRMGYPAMNALNGEMRRMYEEELEKAKNLISPKGVFRLLRIEQKSDAELNFYNSGFTIHSKKVTNLLRRCEIVAVFMSTIGSAVEDEIHTLFEKNELARGFMLDSIGSETADEVAKVMHKDILKNLAKENGYKVTARFSPGYGDWNIRIQKEIVEICSAASIGLQVNESAMMIPRKSVSAVLGFVKKE